MLEDLNWSELNTAQRSAVLLFVPIALFVGWWLGSRMIDRGWAPPVVWVVLGLAGVAAIGVLTLLTGALG